MQEQGAAVKRRRPVHGGTLDAFVATKKEVGDLLGRYVARGGGVPHQLASPEFVCFMEDFAGLFGGTIDTVSERTITRRADKV
jgi:hypothetical protein